MGRLVAVALASLFALCIVTQLQLGSVKTELEVLRKKQPQQPLPEQPRQPVPRPADLYKEPTTLFKNGANLNLEEQEQETDAKTDYYCMWNNTVAHCSEDKVSCFFEVVKRSSNCYGLQIILYSPNTILISWFLILQWHVRYRFAKLCLPVYQRIADLLHRIGIFRKRRIIGAVDCKPFIIWRKLGLNMIVLVIYFGNERFGIVNGKPFVWTVALILFDTVVIFFAVGWAGKTLALWLKMEDTTNETDEQPQVLQSFEFNQTEAADPTDDKDDMDMDDGSRQEKDAATNKFEDLTYRFRRLLPVFFVQVCLMTFYIEQLNNGSGNDDDDIKKASNDVTRVDGVYWLTAVMLQIYCSQDQLGETFSSNLWMKYLVASFGLLRRKLDREFKAIEANDRFKLIESIHLIANEELCSFSLPMQDKPMFRFQLKHEMAVRCLMDFIINSICWSLIVYTFPIMLCVEGPLDFVKDCTAVFFISQLDDIDKKDLREITVKLKYRLLRQQDRRLLHEGFGMSEVFISNTTQNLKLSDHEKAYANDGDNEDQFARIWDHAHANPREKNRLEGMGLKEPEKKDRWTN
jgi:hypothetical protein